MDKHRCSLYTAWDDARGERWGEETWTRKKVSTKQNDSQAAPSDQPGFNIKSQKIKQATVVCTTATELPEKLPSDLVIGSLQSKYV